MCTSTPTILYTNVASHVYHTCVCAHHATTLGAIPVYVMPVCGFACLLSQLDPVVLDCYFSGVSFRRRVLVASFVPLGLGLLNLVC